MARPEEIRVRAIGMFVIGVCSSATAIIMVERGIYNFMTLASSVAGFIGLVSTFVFIELKTRT